MATNRKWDGPRPAATPGGGLTQRCRKDCPMTIDWMQTDDPELKGTRWHAVCRLGEGRWWWCCKVFDWETSEDIILASGNATNREDAQAQVAAVLAPRRDAAKFLTLNAANARHEYRRLLAQQQ